MPPTKRRRGLASNGLDAVIPAAAASSGGADQAPEPDPPAASQPPSRVKFSAYMSTDVADRVRNAVAALGQTTVGEFLDAACTTYIDQLEDERGEPFAARSKPNLRVGRRPA